MVNLPKGWDEIFVDQFIDLKNLSDDDMFFNRQIKILSILTDTDANDERWLDLDVEELAKSIGSLNWMKSDPTNNFKVTINDLTAIDINKLSFGEFIDLEYYFNLNYFENLSKICAIMYRKTKTNEWGDLVFEDYSNINIEKRSEVFDELPISYIYGIIDYYLTFKKKLFSTYETLFEPQIEGDEDETNYDAEDLKEMENEKAMQQWGWENVLYKLSNNDITKYDQITKMPVIFIFNQMSFIKDMKL